MKKIYFQDCVNVSLFLIMVSIIFSSFITSDYFTGIDLSMTGNVIRENGEYYYNMNYSAYPESLAYAGKEITFSALITRNLEVFPDAACTAFVENDEYGMGLNNELGIYETKHIFQNTGKYEFTIRCSTYDDTQEYKDVIDVLPEIPDLRINLNSQNSVEMNKNASINITTIS